MEENIFKDSLNDSLFWRIAAHCPPSNRGSGPMLSQSHALANLEDRLLEALAPTQHDLELSAFDLMLAAQYEEVKFPSQIHLRHTKPARPENTYTKNHPFACRPTTSSSSPTHPTPQHSKPNFRTSISFPNPWTRLKRPRNTPACTNSTSPTRPVSFVQRSMYSRRSNACR